MVDVGSKAETVREAVAEAEVHIGREAIRAIRRKTIAKGDPLQAARLAGIMAAKRTADLIPLCHPLPLTHVDVDLCRAVSDISSSRARARLDGQASKWKRSSRLRSPRSRSTTCSRPWIGPSSSDPFSLREKRGGRSGVYRRTP